VVATRKAASEVKLRSDIASGVASPIFCGTKYFILGEQQYFA